jgi:hypothetical protein
MAFPYVLPAAVVPEHPFCDGEPLADRAAHTDTDA